MRKQFVFAAVATVAVLFASAGAQASVKVYRQGDKTLILATDLKVSSIQNEGLAGQQLIEYLNQNLSVFKQQGAFDGESLQMRRTHRDRRGATIRLVQRFNRVHIENADLVANFDVYGKLKTLNSSLMTTPPSTFNVMPDLSKESAIAVARRQFTSPEAIPNTPDARLLIVPASPTPYLVWEVNLREREDGAAPEKIQVIAKGSRSGRILKSISLAHPSTSIYDASTALLLPSPTYRGVLVMKDGISTAKGKALGAVDRKSYEQALAADTNFAKVLDFYRQAFERNGFDNRGAEVVAAVNTGRVRFFDFLGMGQNAAWMSPWSMFVFGSGGKLLAGFAEALDVVGHEFTHAVVSHTSDLAYEGQSGALNEHMADVFGAMIEDHAGEAGGNPWLIGDTVLRGELAQKADALRDMQFPAKGVTPQPGRMDEIPTALRPGCVASRNNDNCGVHILSGIPNYVSFKIVSTLGWERTRGLFYRVMTARLRSNSDFADYKVQMMDECAESMASSDCRVVDSAFKAVGL